jgi:hypothetical protein
VSKSPVPLARQQQRKKGLATSRDRFLVERLFRENVDADPTGSGLTISGKEIERIVGVDFGTCNLITGLLHERLNCLDILAQTKRGLCTFRLRAGSKPDANYCQLRDDFLKYPVPRRRSPAQWQAVQKPLKLRDPKFPKRWLSPDYLKELVLPRVLISQIEGRRGAIPKFVLGKEREAGIMPMVDALYVLWDTFVVKGSAPLTEEAVEELIPNRSAYFIGAGYLQPAELGKPQYQFNPDYIRSPPFPPLAPVAPSAAPALPTVPKRPKLRRSSDDDGGLPHPDPSKVDGFAAVAQVPLEWVRSALIAAAKCPSSAVLVIENAQLVVKWTI